MSVPRPATGTIPDAPGSYLFRDGEGRVVYVGKARSLRKRVSSYWGRPLHPRTESMLEAATSVEWVIASTEVDALLLEYNLIRQHQPRFNVRFRDDKSYPYLAISVAQTWPRAQIVRGAKRKGLRYFGPYAHAYAIRETLDALGRVFPVRTCTDAFFAQRERARRPCLAYDIGRCAGPCVPALTGVTEAAYREHVDELVSFLAGKTRPVIARLEHQMTEAAEAQEYERAARLRDSLAAARRATETQEVVLSQEEDLDVVAIAADDIEAAIQVFFVRDGRVVGRKGWVVDRVEDLDEAGLIGGFLRQLYMEREEVAPTILVSQRPQEASMLETWLTQRRGGPVRLAVPQRGAKRRLLEIVGTNADEHFRRHKLRRASDFAARSRALTSLADELGLPQAPLRIECFDISNLGPDDKVASMVVFEDGMPRRSDYRRFEIRGVSGQDDFASMEEAVSRRLARLAEEPTAHRRFAYRPSLIVIDGGRGQLGAAMRAMTAAGADIPMIGLAKRFEEVYFPDRADPLRIERGSDALHLLQHIRDEAHRFAVSYHRTKRAGRAHASALDAIPGVGAARRTALLRRFGSMKGVARASVDEIAAVRGIGPVLARQIHDALVSPDGAARRESA